MTMAIKIAIRVATDAATGRSLASLPVMTGPLSKMQSYLVTKCWPRQSRAATRGKARTNFGASPDRSWRERVHVHRANPPPGPMAPVER
jgi:hypothetical protein